MLKRFAVPGTSPKFSAQGEALDEVRLGPGEVTGSPCHDAETVQALGLTFPVATTPVRGERFLESGARRIDVASCFEESSEVPKGGGPPQFVDVRAHLQGALEVRDAFLEMTMAVPELAEGVGQSQPKFGSLAVAASGLVKQRVECRAQIVEFGPGGVVVASGARCLGEREVVDGMALA